MSEELLRVAKEVTAKDKPEEALAAVLKEYIQRRIDKCEQKIKKFESKYSVGIKESYEKLGTDFSLSWECEKDYRDWDWAIAELEELKGTLEKLKTYGN
jgi:arginyl-tRNA synthetase